MCSVLHRLWQNGISISLHVTRRFNGQCKLHNLNTENSPSAPVNAVCKTAPSRLIK